MFEEYLFKFITFAQHLSPEQLGFGPDYDWDNEALCFGMKYATAELYDLDYDDISDYYDPTEYANQKFVYIEFHYYIRNEDGTIRFFDQCRRYLPWERFLELAKQNKGFGKSNFRWTYGSNSR